MSSKSSKTPQNPYMPEAKRGPRRPRKTAPKAEAPKVEPPKSAPKQETKGCGGNCKCKATAWEYVSLPALPKSVDEVLPWLEKLLAPKAKLERCARCAASGADVQLHPQLAGVYLCDDCLVQLRKTDAQVTQPAKSVMAEPAPAAEEKASPRCSICGAADADWKISGSEYCNSCITSAITSIFGKPIGEKPMLCCTFDSNTGALVDVREDKPAEQLMDALVDHAVLSVRLGSDYDDLCDAAQAAASLLIGNACGRTAGELLKAVDALGKRIEALQAERDIAGGRMLEALAKSK